MHIPFSTYDNLLLCKNKHFLRSFDEATINIHGSVEVLLNRFYTCKSFIVCCSFREPHPLTHTHGRYRTPTPTHSLTVNSFSACLVKICILKNNLLRGYTLVTYV